MGDLITFHPEISLPVKKYRQLSILYTPVEQGYHTLLISSVSFLSTVLLAITFKTV